MVLFIQILYILFIQIVAKSLLMKGGIELSTRIDQQIKIETILLNFTGKCRSFLIKQIPQRFRLQQLDKFFFSQKSKKWFDRWNNIVVIVVIELFRTSSRRSITLSLRNIKITLQRIYESFIGCLSDSYNIHLKYLQNFENRSSIFLPYSSVSCIYIQRNGSISDL